MKIDIISSNLQNSPSKKIAFNGVYRVDSGAVQNATFYKNTDTKDLYDSIIQGKYNDDVLYTRSGSITASVDSKIPALIITNDEKGADAAAHLGLRNEYQEAKTKIFNKTDDELKVFAKEFCTPKTEGGLKIRSGKILQNFVARKMREQFQKRELTFFNELLKKATVLNQDNAMSFARIITKDITNFASKVK